MTTTTTTARGQMRTGSLTRRLRSALVGMADRAHARGDAHAQAIGWTVAATPGPLGLAGRTYRDPRFTTRRPGRESPARPGRPA